jgi:hypothetical protein
MSGNYWQKLAQTKVADLPRLCWSCEFWLPEINWDVNPPEEKEIGGCHRFPPTRATLLAGGESAFPRTWEGDGCGEWRVGLPQARAVQK